MSSTSPNFHLRVLPRPHQANANPLSRMAYFTWLRLTDWILKCKKLFKFLSVKLISDENLILFDFTALRFSYLTAIFHLWLEISWNLIFFSCFTLSTQYTKLQFSFVDEHWKGTFYCIYEVFFSLIGFPLEKVVHDKSKN